MFDNYSETRNEGSDRPKIEVDWRALDEYTVETAGLETPEVLVGVVTGIVDLGIQAQEDAEFPFEGNEQDEADAIADKPDTYFITKKDERTGKMIRFKCYPQKAIQSVAIAVDFPEIQLDKGQFFGDDSGQTAPLRLWLGGQFYNSAVQGMVVGRPTPLKLTKNTKGHWSLHPLNIFYKMALAAGLIKTDDVFLPANIDQLIGKAFLFEAQVFFKEVKDKKYFTEKVNFKSKVSRGQAIPDTTDLETFVVQFNKPNDPESLKHLRKHVVNTIKSAHNYEGSPIQAQLEQVKPYLADDKASKPVEPEKTSSAPAETKKRAGKTTPVKPPVDEDDPDVPF